MRILILGNNHSAETFFKLLAENNENIVFSTNPNVKNYIKCENKDDTVEFCKANEINFVVITETSYINSNLSDELNSLEIANFAPAQEAINICKYRSYAKKIYK